MKDLIQRAVEWRKQRGFPRNQAVCIDMAAFASQVTAETLRDAELLLWWVSHKVENTALGVRFGNSLVDDWRERILDEQLKHSNVGT